MSGSGRCCRKRPRYVARNYRISGADILNPSCAFDADLKSILLGDPPQNPFSTASVRSGRDAFVKQCPLLSQNRTSVRFDNLAKYDCKIKVRFEGAVADAVAFEPVATLKFPANREKNREFRRIHQLDAVSIADKRIKSKAFSRIPCATEQGIFSNDQGNPPRHQGSGAAAHFLLRKALNRRSHRTKQFERTRVRLATIKLV